MDRADIGQIITVVQFVGKTKLAPHMVSHRSHNCILAAYRIEI